jgi:hypothetical protein
MPADPPRPPPSPGTTQAAPRAWRAWAAIALLFFITNLPAAIHTRWIPYEAFTLSGEVLVLLLLARALPRRLGPAAFAVLWTPVLAFELARLFGHYLMNQDPLLFDLYVLLRHLRVLLRDLWGTAGALVPVGVLLVVGLVGVLAAWVSRPAIRGGPRTRTLAALTGVAAVGLVVPGPWPGRWSAQPLRTNLVESYALWERTQSILSPDDYVDHDAVTLARKPDVELYVIESYGRLLERPLLVRPWNRLLGDTSVALQERGWHSASAFATAPVSGGRSWLSDASVMLGVDIHYEAMWQAVRPQLGGARHLPGFFAGQGYQTVVVRPKDRARKGVKLRNDFAWMHPVFHDEIAYEGPALGWGVIPDQYSLGRLHDDLLPPITGPRFLFFHGVSSHGPWDAVPPRVDDWRELDSLDAEGEVHKEKRRRDGWVLERAAQLHLRHEKKRTEGPLKKWAEAYFLAINYSLRVTVDALGDAPTGGDGRIVVLYGDHQPPLMAEHKDFDVPVHVLASDPALLEAFLDAGFIRGMRPGGAPSLRLSGLHSLLVDAVARGSGQSVPVERDGLGGD